MRTIWKHVLDLQTNIIVIEMPLGAEILTAREQGSAICIWYQCDPTQPMEKRKFVIVPTGGAAPDQAPYIGTVLLEGGMYVFHVFELIHNN
jgi:hypothetical protein